VNSVSLLTFNMFVVMVILEPSKSYCWFVIYWFQNGDVYIAAELPCKQIAKLEKDLLDLYCLWAISKYHALTQNVLLSEGTSLRNLLAYDSNPRICRKPPWLRTRSRVCAV